jgi:glycosyltransferase involved in cell wall biosynthesis
MKDSFKPNHVVYIITKLELGGAQKVCLDLMSGLKQLNIPTTLITGAQGPLVNQTQQFDSVIFLRSLKREIRLRNFFLEIRNFFNLIQILRKLKKQHGSLIVHTHSTKAGLVGRWASFFARIPNRIHTVHGYGFHDHQWFFSWFIIYFLELITSFITTHYICVSERDRSTGCRLFPNFARKSSIIRASVEQKDFIGFTPSTATTWSATQQTSPIIGTVSCFKPQKNLFDLLKAFKLVYQTMLHDKRPTPLLHIIGDGEQRNTIEAWIRNEQLTDAIILLGWQKDVASWMKSWHIFAMSSLWEGLPRAIVEARLCKLPVVSYAIGGIPEVIFHGKNGLLAWPNHWRELAAHIIELLKNTDHHLRLKTFNDQLGDFDTSIMIKKHLILYKNIASKSHQL